MHTQRYIKQHFKSNNAHSN